MELGKAVGADCVFPRGVRDAACFIIRDLEHQVDDAPFAEASVKQWHQIVKQFVGGGLALGCLGTDAAQEPIHKQFLTLHAHAVGAVPDIHTLADKVVCHVPPKQNLGALDESRVHLGQVFRHRYRYAAQRIRYRPNAAHVDGHEMVDRHAVQEVFYRLDRQLAAALPCAAKAVGEADLRFAGARILAQHGKDGNVRQGITVYLQKIHGAAFFVNGDKHQEVCLAAGAEGELALLTIRILVDAHHEDVGKAGIIGVGCAA